MGGGGGGTDGIVAGNPSFSGSMCSLCLSVILCVSIARASAETLLHREEQSRASLPGDDLNVEACQGYFQGVLEVLLLSSS